MARKNTRKEESFAHVLYELLLVIPAWCGPIVVAVAYIATRWAFPWLLSAFTQDDSAAKTTSDMLASLSVAFSPWIATAVLIIWLVAETTKWNDRRRLDRQTGLKSIQQLTWSEFELLLCEAFRRQGFGVEHNRRPSPDGGIDIRLSMAGAVTLVQCKHWKARSVGVKVVRELLGVVTSERAQSGIVVTSGAFTRDAVDFAERNPIRLIEGEQLVSMITEVQRSGATRAAVASEIADQRAKVATETATPACPKCGATTVRRIAKSGPHAGSAFFGCSRYPKCRSFQAISE